MAPYNYSPQGGIGQTDVTRLHPGYQPHHPRQGAHYVPYEDDHRRASPRYYDHDGDYELRVPERRPRSRRRPSIDSEDDHYHYSRSHSRAHSQASHHSHRSHSGDRDHSRSHRDHHHSRQRSYSPESVGADERQARRRTPSAVSDVAIRHRPTSISPSPEDHLDRYGMGPPALKRSLSADPYHPMPMPRGSTGTAAGGHGHVLHKPTNPNARHALEVAIGNGARAAFRVSGNGDGVPRSMGAKAAKVAGTALAAYLIDYTLDRNAKQHPMKHLGVSMLQGAVMDQLLDGHGINNLTHLGRKKPEESPF